MGMYNEVFATCPKCGGLGYMQIGQIVLGFGGFRIDDPDSLAERLDCDQLTELHEAVCSRNFICGDDTVVAVERAVHGGDAGKGCGHVFNPLLDKSSVPTDRQELARRLFGK